MVHKVPTSHRVHQRLARTYKDLAARFSPSISSPFAMKVAYTAGAVLRRTTPRFKRVLPRLGAAEETWTLIGDSEEEAALDLPRDSYSYPPVKRDGNQPPPPSTPAVEHRPTLDVKIHPNLIDLELSFSTNTLASAYPSPISSTSSDLDAASTSSSYYSEPEPTTTSLSRSASPGSSSFRSLPANWAPGQPVPEYATNHIRRVDLDMGFGVSKRLMYPPGAFEGSRREYGRFVEEDGEPVYMTVLAPSPRKKGRSVVRDDGESL